MKDALKLALVIEEFDKNDESLPLELLKPIAATLRALAQPEQEPEQEPEYRCCPHDSDCAVHNMPAYPAGPCDCTYKNTFNTPLSIEIHEVCLALANREIDKLTNENFGRTPNDSWANKVINVYHFFDSNPKAKTLTVLYTTPPQRSWVGLTDEEIKEIVGPYGDMPIKGYTRKLFDQIEAKLEEKNT